MTWVHPAQLIFILKSVEDVGEDDEDWQNPAQDAQHHQEHLLLYEGLDQDHPEESSLGQHPAVGGHHEVGCEDVEAPTPDSIAGPNIRVKQYQIVPNFYER